MTNELQEELKDELGILVPSLRAAARATLHTPDAELEAALLPYWLEMMHRLFAAAGACPCGTARCLSNFPEMLAEKTAELPFFGLPGYLELVREARDQAFAEMAAGSDASA